MSPLTLALIMIAALFAMLLAAKHTLKRKFCAICGAVGGTWLVLLIARGSGLFNDANVIALLVGESVVGIYYLMERRVRGDLLIFRLPALLTLTAVGYGLVAGAAAAVAAIVPLGALWVAFVLSYIYRRQPGLRRLAEKLIACCRDR